MKLDVFDKLTHDPASGETAPADVFDIAHQESDKAVKLFLPSSLPKSQAPPDIPPQIDPEIMELVGSMAMADKVELASMRVARGLPPVEEEPDPFQEFGHELHPVHIDAISTALQHSPEHEMGNLITEAHGNVTRWIHSNGGKVVVDGKIHIADSLEQAEKLAQKIVNEAIDNEDQKRDDLNNPESQIPSITASDAALPKTSGSAADVLPSQNPQNRPEIVPPGDKDKPPSGPVPEVTPEESSNIGRTDEETQRPILQPKDTQKENTKLTLQAAPELHAALSQLTAGIPGVSYERIRPLKSQDRTENKIDEGKPPETISDYLGAQIAADSPQAKDQLLNAIGKSFKIVEVDDHFLEGREDKAGYPSTNVQVQLSNGSTAEVQIVPKEVQDINRQSHVFYKAGRDAEAKGDNQERDKQWAQAKAMHDDALNKFKMRNGMSAQPQVQETGSIPGTAPIPNNPGGAADSPAASSTVSIPSANDNNDDRLRQSLESSGYSLSSKPFRIGNRLFIGVQELNRPPQAVPAPEAAPAATEAPETGVKEAIQSPGQAENEPKYKYASTQVNLSGDAAKKVTDFGKKIPDEHLTGKGREEFPHVTVRYGLENENPEEVKQYLSKQRPFVAKLGETNVFPPTESSDGAAVVHAKVESPELVRIHKAIGSVTPTTHNDFTDENYKPHATIAYVKPEVADQYKGKADLKGQKVKVSSIHISDRNGNLQEAKLGGKPQKGDEVMLADGRSGKLMYLHPELNKARVKIDGKNVDINTKELA